MAPTALLWRRWLPLLCSLVLTGARAAEVIPPAPTAYFNDYARLVRPDTAQALNAQLDQFERATSNQFLVVIYPKMESESSIDDYTVRVAQSWRVGQKAHDNGAVLFIFAQEHKLYIQTGYGLEGALPDALCKRIIDQEIVPHFRQNDFDGGLTAGVTAILAAVRGEYRGTGATVADRRGGSRSGGGIFDLIRIGAFLLFFIVYSVVRSRRHVVYGAAGRGGLWGGGPWIFPGGGGFSGGGGGGGGGGFSGGGGSFGGGGAGGSW